MRAAAYLGKEVMIICSTHDADIPNIPKIVRGIMREAEQDGVVIDIMCGIVGKTKSLGNYHHIRYNNIVRIALVMGDYT